jgi:hypothetical protein
LLPFPLKFAAQINNIAAQKNNFAAKKKKIFAAQKNNEVAAQMKRTFETDFSKSSRWL